jgi:hypothetical protein
MTDPTDRPDVSIIVEKLLAQAEAETANLPKPIASVSISKAGNAIDICLDNTKSGYGDWIKGEGADIALQRDNETNKVIGARLPLYAKSLVICGEVLPLLRFDLETGKQIPLPAAEPSERELPTHWGHWVRNGEHYWVYGKGQMFHIQRLNTETGLPHEDTADFAITLNSAEMRGHWRPAVPDTDAYADAERDRLREAVKAEIAQRNAFIAEINSVLPEPNGMTCKERIVLMRAERDRFQEGWIASNELVEHLRAEQKAWQAAMDQVRKLRVKQRPERTDWDRDDPDIHGH